MSILEVLPIFLIVFYIGAPIAISSFVGHLATALFSLYFIRNVSSVILFWILLLLIFVFASESRFSLEYFLFASTLFSFGFSDYWTNKKNFEARQKILMLVFILIFIFGLFKMSYSERGSLLLWFPVYLAVYFEKLNKKTWLLYAVSGIGALLTSKFTILISFILALRSKLIYFLSVIPAVVYFKFFQQQSLNKFVDLSVMPRIHVWKSVLIGFLDKPIFGHGFGTFALDFPIYRAHGDFFGGKVNNQVVHGHNMFFHTAFESGAIGVCLLCLIFYIVYKKSKPAFLPFLVIALFDCPVMSFNQFFLCGIILGPILKEFFVENKFIVIQSNIISKSVLTIAILIALYSYVPSLIGHYYYSIRNYDSAIKWDRQNPLYYFSRGANTLHLDSVSAEKDLALSVKLSPKIPYFYGFLGAAQLSNGKFEESSNSLKKAIEIDGEDSYWCILYAFANYHNKPIYEKYRKLAFHKSPEIKQLLKRADLKATQAIYSSKFGDIRIPGFYRMGEVIYYPLPVVE